MFPLFRLMGHSETLLELHWRHIQLLFLFNYGISVIPNIGIDLARKFILYLSQIAIYTLQYFNI